MNMKQDSNTPRRREGTLYIFGTKIRERGELSGNYQKSTNEPIGGDANTSYTKEAATEEMHESRREGVPTMCRTNNRTPRNMREDGDEATSGRYSGTAVRHGKTTGTTEGLLNGTVRRDQRRTRVAIARHRKQRY